MRALIEGGHVYIAQPPLYRAKRGRSETYIKDDRELESWLIRRAIESRTLRLPKRDIEVSGAQLEEVLHKVMGFRKLMEVVERRGVSRDVITALLSHGARDRSFFSDRPTIEDLASELSSPTRMTSVGTDEEHNALVLHVDDRTGGYPRRHSVGVDFVMLAEYRALLGSFEDGDIRALDGTLVVSSVAAPRGAVSEADDKDDSGEDEAVASESRDGHKKQDVQIESIDELVEFFITAGKRGVAVNRYKGLGEMNPYQLWETKMKPESRTQLQVRA